MLELAGALVPEQDGEHVEVDDAFEESADAFEEVVGIKDGGDLARYLMQHSQGLCLSGHAGVEARVFDRDGDTGSGKFEQALVVGSEESWHFGLQVEHANDLVLDDERDGQLGAHGGVGVDVVFELADVLDEDRLALQRGLPDDAAAQLDADALDVRRVAGLEAHPQLVGAIVDQENGEDAVVDDGADEVGDAVQQRVQIERGVEGIGEADEEVELQGFDADVGVGGVRVK